MLENYGDPNCSVCHGRGRLPAEGNGPPALTLCRCVLHQEILENVERGMRGLSKAAKVPASPLTKFVAANARVTASTPWFQAHLRHVAVRQSPRWGFRVCTDADLMQAWLATAALQGHEIRDPDAADGLGRRSLDFLTLVDIALPPTLLIIRLGVKSARNVAMPEVLLEAIRVRTHEGRPTWVWDQPDNPLMEGHLSWSPSVVEEISGWSHVREGDEDRLPPTDGGVVRRKRKADTGSAGQNGGGGSVRDLFLKGGDE